MTVAVGLLALIVVALAAALAFARLVRQAEVKRHEEFQELAARRGWSLTVTREMLGRPAVMRIQPRGGSGFMVESRRLRGHPGGASAEFSTREPIWTGGAMLMSAPLPPEMDALVNLMPEGLKGPLGQKVAARLLGENAGVDLASLRRQPSPDDVTVMADAAIGNHFDIAALARAYTVWQPVQKGDKGWPVLIISRDGMRLRLRHELSRADMAERFIDLALELARLG